MNEWSADVVVVGGGIVGAAAAAFLAEAGARVVLVEREGLASGASGANSGSVQHPFDPALAGLYRETVALYRDLSARVPAFHMAPEPAGMLFVSAHERDARRLAGTVGEAFPGLRTEVLEGAALERLEPALAPGLWACRIDIGYPVLPSASTYAYATLAEFSRGGAAPGPRRGAGHRGRPRDGCARARSAPFGRGSPGGRRPGIVRAGGPELSMDPHPGPVGRRGRGGSRPRAGPHHRGGGDRSRARAAGRGRRSQRRRGNFGPHRGGSRCRDQRRAAARGDRRRVNVP